MYLLTRRRLPPDTVSDAEAKAFLEAVQIADGQRLERLVRNAFNNFVIGNKADPSPNAGVSNWDAIKSCCVLAGARTLAGALVPLKGTAPTNVGFTPSDYNRKTGLKGNGVNKGINTNRLNSADPQTNNHNAIWVSEATTLTSVRYVGTGVSLGDNSIVRNISNISFQSRTSGANITVTGAQNATGFIGMSRIASGLVTARVASANTSNTLASSAPPANNVWIFSRVNLLTPSDGRIAFYSIGEAVDLALFDARVTALMNALNAAIP